MKTRLAVFALATALAAGSTSASAADNAGPDRLDMIKSGALEVLSETEVLRSATQQQAGSTSYLTDRIAGQDRYETAALISKATYADDGGLPFGQVIFVTTGQNYPDALASGPAAAGLFGSVLLVPSRGTVPPAVLNEVSRLHGMSPPAGVSIIILGGEGAVSADVAGQVFSAAPGSPSRTRISGTNRYDTARQLADLVVAWDESGEEPVPVEPDTAYLASGQTFADALAGGAAAAWEYAPLLLTQPSALPAETAAALTDRGYTTVKILGGPASVSPDVEAQVRALLPGVEIVRYDGQDRFETAALMNEDVFGFLDTEIHLANGLDYPDALAVAPRVNLSAGPTVLTRSGCLPPSSAATIDALQPWLVTAIGGAAVVSAAALDGSTC